MLLCPVHGSRGCNGLREQLRGEATWVVRQWQSVRHEAGSHSEQIPRVGFDFVVFSILLVYRVTFKLGRKLYS